MKKVHTSNCENVVIKMKLETKHTVDSLCIGDTWTMAYFQNLIIYFKKNSTVWSWKMACPGVGWACRQFI